MFMFKMPQKKLSEKDRQKLIDMAFARGAELCKGEEKTLLELLWLKLAAKADEVSREMANEALQAGKDCRFPSTIDPKRACELADIRASVMGRLDDLLQEAN